MPAFSCPACQIRVQVKSLVSERPILCPRCRSVVVLSELGAKLGDTFAIKEEPPLASPGLRPLPRRRDKPDEDLIDYRPKWHPLVIIGMALGGGLVVVLVLFLLTGLVGSKDAGIAERSKEPKEVAPERPKAEAPPPPDPALKKEENKVPPIGGGKPGGLPGIPKDGDDLKLFPPKKEPPSRFPPQPGQAPTPPQPPPEPAQPNARVRARVEELERILRQKPPTKTPPKDRIAAAKELGDLKTDAWDARRDLCVTLLETMGRNPALYQAADDALFAICPDLEKLARGVLVTRILNVEEVKKLGSWAKPLTPIITRFAEDHAGQPIVAAESIRLLPVIAADDREAAERMGQMLQLQGNAGVSETIAIELRGMEYAVLAVNPLLACMKPGILETVRYQAAVTLLDILQRPKLREVVPPEYKIATTQQKIKATLWSLRSDGPPRLSELVRNHEDILKP
jgi:hypothetical protein